jgi:Sulfotransferase domain.
LCAFFSDSGRRSAEIDMPQRKDEDQPFFIVGSGRSGTTLLRMILASHSRLAIPPETYFLDPLLKRLPATRPLTKDEVARAIAIVTGSIRWPDMGIDADTYAAEASALAQPTLRDLVEIVYRTHLVREGKQRWGDKTPAYIRIVPQLAELYPGARFIHLLRDGRDVAKSFQSVGWYGPLLNRNMGEWLEATELDARWRQGPLADRLFLVRYEDLVRDTERTVRGICEFLGEAYEPQMLAWEDKVDRLVPQREMGIHAKLRRRPDPGDIERWRREMSLSEQLVAEAFMGRELSRAGYARRFGGLLWQPLMPAVRYFCRLVLPLASAVWSRVGLNARKAASARS